MKCNNFENVIYDMARNKIVDAALADQALAHIDGCAECEARLDEQNSITSGLRALKETYEKVEAPLHIEAALLESFRRLNQPVENTPDIAVGSFKRNSHNYVIKYAAAAAILLILGIAAWQLEGAFSKESKEQAENAQPVNPAPAQPDKKEESEPQKNPAPAIAHNLPEKNERRNWPTTSKKAKINRNPIGSNEVASTNKEIVTEFIPLVDLDNISEMERGRLLRVQVPRSTLQSFGLPVNVARTNEPIMADVLVGDDGLARAIRFVR